MVSFTLASFAVLGAFASSILALTPASTNTTVPATIYAMSVTRSSISVSSVSVASSSALTHPSSGTASAPGNHTQASGTGVVYTTNIVYKTTTICPGSTMNTTAPATSFATSSIKANASSSSRVVYSLPSLPSITTAVSQSHRQASGTGVVYITTNMTYTTTTSCPVGATITGTNGQATTLRSATVVTSTAISHSLVPSTAGPGYAGPTAGTASASGSGASSNVTTTGKPIPFTGGAGHLEAGAFVAGLVVLIAAAL